MRNLTFARLYTSLGMLVLLACTALSPQALAQSTTPPSAEVVVAGVKFPPMVQVGDRNLPLNGAGIRTRFVVQVYAAGLYLPAKTTSAETALTATGAKRLHVVMLRDINASELGRLFTRGMQDNASKEDFSKSIPGTITMSDIFSAQKRLTKGESFSVDFVPGVGTQVLVNGKPVGTVIAEPEFFRSLLAIWLGPKPVDDALKRALLGEDAAGPNPNATQR